MNKESKKIRKALIIMGKIVIFWGLWLEGIVIGTNFEIPQNQEFERLLFELIPLVIVILLTFIFIKFLEKEFPPLYKKKTVLPDTIKGVLLSIIWLGTPILLLYILGILHFDSYQPIPKLSLWILAVACNAALQEILVRGYVFTLLRKNYNTPIAVIITSLIFVILHGGAFEVGVVPVINVLTMSILVSLLLIYTGSLIMPIVVHALWNGLGCLLFGVVSLGGAYPSMLQATLSGSTLWTGGSTFLEGSIAVLFTNVLIITVLILYQQKKNRGGTTYKPIPHHYE